MTYDSSLPVVSAIGGLQIGGTPTNQGISQLSVAFYTPLSLTPVYSTSDISNSVITYKLLSISFDTVSRTLFGFLDVGRDSFAEGDTGSSIGQFYLTGVSSPALHDSFAAQVVDSGGQFTTVPEPCGWMLGMIGFVTMVAFRSWSRPKP
jgi:hypothetical protein